MILMAKKTALFIGRFQPLHHGHIHAIRHAQKKYNTIIAVGSINKRDEKNPFSYQKRRKMVLSVFPNAEIIGINDTTDEKWTRKIKKLKFDIVISGNPKVWRCLKDCLIEKPQFLKFDKYNGSEIRKMIKSGKNIDKLVPKNVRKAIEA